MATKTTTPKTHYATKNFKDAGTERSFIAGEEITDATAGELANYVAAGAASTEKLKADDAAAAETKQSGEKPTA